MKQILVLITFILSSCSSINSFYENRSDYSAGTTSSLYWNQEQCYYDNREIYLEEHPEERIPRYPNTYFKHYVGENKQLDEFMQKACPHGYFTEKMVAGIPEYFLNIFMLPIKILDQTGAVFMGHSSFDTREKTKYYLDGFFALPFAILFTPFTTIRGRPNYEFLEE